MPIEDSPQSSIMDVVPTQAEPVVTQTQEPIQTQQTQEPTQTQAQEPTQTQTADPSWLDRLTPEARGGMESKGYKSEQELADGYLNLSKHLGYDKKDVLRKPKDGEDRTELREYLGVPKTIEEYAHTAIEGFDAGDRFDIAKKIAFEGDVSAETFKKLADAEIQHEAERQVAVTKAKDEAIQADVESMKMDWGVEHDTIVQQADAALRAINAGPNGIVITNKQRDSISEEIGLKASILLFSELYKHSGEDTVTNILGEKEIGLTEEGVDFQMNEIIEKMGADRKLRDEFDREGPIYDEYQKLKKTSARIEAGNKK